jgi:3-oxoacyl-[acyl-carrier-protein] synthase II
MRWEKSMRNRRRVVITGMGAITPLGHQVDELYQSQIEGRSGIGVIHRFDARNFPTKFASQVKDFSLSKFLTDGARWEHCGLNTRFALAAARQAIDDAGLLDNPRIDPADIGVYLGSGEGGHDFKSLVQSVARSVPENSYAADPRVFFSHSRQQFNGRHEFEMEMHMTTARLAEAFNLQGPNMTCQTACAASSQAIGEAAEVIRHGDAPIMVSGGAHSMIHPFGVTGFNLLTALSTNNREPQKASRPFDFNRDGFVLGEGAGIVVLEDLEHAKKRGAHIYAEISGYGTTADAFRVTDSHEDGRGAIAAIRQAMADSQLPLDAIGYVNAHGTSTKVNDRSETIALKTVFGERAYKLPVSSSKSMLGHLICAAGAVELIISVMAIRKGVLPPTINYETPDPECDLDYIPNEARMKKVDHVLSNSFGFGGQNISLIVSRF